jgi:hypothetical protein
MTLPDTAFFDLVRSILGTVKTPFNKQTLVEELSRFLAQPEIQETMAAYINGDDRRMIAAIALLGEPVPGELESFFTGEYSFTELQTILLNLEERLIIYRFRDNGLLRIALNPRLESILAPHASDTEILFPMAAGLPEFNAAQTKGGMPDRRTLAAFFAFLLGSEVQIKDDGAGKNHAFTFRKKTADQGKELFPGLDIDAIAGGLLALGLLVQEEESRANRANIVPNEDRIDAFKALSDQVRFEYLAGGIALFFHHGRISGSYQSRELLKTTVRLIHSLSDLAKDGRVFPEATMIKLTELFRRQNKSNWAFPEELPSAQILLQSVVAAGLFTLAPIDETNCYVPVRLRDDPGNKRTNKPEAKQHPLIAMDSGFSCILYPEIGFADALDLAAFSTVEETGTTIRFALSRDSVIRGFDRGFNAEFLWQLLERLSGGRIPDTLKWNLDDWEKRWKEVSLSQGVVLTLKGDRGYLAQTEPLASMIKQNLAPGIYLLSAGPEEASEALHNAGVDTVARPNHRETKKNPPSFFFLTEKPNSFMEESTVPIEPSPKLTGVPPEDRAEHIKTGFRQALETMKLTKQEQEELKSRIERRIVVSETQLKDTSLRFEKMEARSLDYVGKTGIVKQAIVSGSLLELSCLNGEKILGVPESLDKKGGEMILTIKPKKGADMSGEPVKLALGKISLIRRIKQSIFGV